MDPNMDLNPPYPCRLLLENFPTLRDLRSLGFTLFCGSAGQEVCFTPAGATFPILFPKVPCQRWVEGAYTEHRQPNTSQSHQSQWWNVFLEEQLWFVG